MKRFYYAFLLLLISISGVMAQEWGLTGSAPEGGGITDLLVRESNSHLFAVTGSFNWPNGTDGGIRRSTDEGETWQNLMDAYTGRAIIEGPDGELLASVWEYPADEGLYRSTDNGNTWDLLVDVPSGNNIFSIAIYPGTPNIIYAGTRTGVYRSLDNGATWAYANNGIPGNSWVRGLDVNADGVVAAGTTNGLYVSMDNGDNWDKVTGAGENDTVVSVNFYQLPASKDDESNLLAGTASGKLLLTTAAVLFATAVLVHNFGPGQEITRTRLSLVSTALAAYFFVSMYSQTGGNFFMALGNTSNWNPFVNGLAASTIISIFTVSVFTVTTVVLYLGMFGNTANGAKVYKATIDASTGIENQPFLSNSIFLNQNRPNPFNRETTIDYTVPDDGFVTMKVFDVSGKLVSVLVNQKLQKGSHTLKLSANHLEPGAYYYVLRAGEAVETKKFMIQ